MSRAPRLIRPDPNPRLPAVVRFFRRSAAGTAQLQTQPSGAQTDLLHFSTSQIAESEQKISGGLFVFDCNVTIAFQPAVCASEQEGRSVVAIVRVAIAHAASKVDDYPIQERRVTVGCRLKFTDEFRELLRVVSGDLCIFLDAFGLIAMMRHRMMGLWNTDVSVASAATFVTHHESKDTRDVAL